MPKIGECKRPQPPTLAQRTAGRGNSNRPHDPLACGIMRRLDCNGCLRGRLSFHELTSPHEAAEDRWELLCRTWPALRRAERWRKAWDGWEDRLPRCPRPEVLGAVLWALLQPGARDALRRALMQVLAKDIAYVVAEVLQDAR